jgi:threonine dehydratase
LIIFSLLYYYYIYYYIIYYFIYFITYFIFYLQKGNERLCKKLGVSRLCIVSESFQYGGSFKFRGAFNVASQIKQQTIISNSSGNFGIAISLASKITEKKCIVVMPHTAAEVKKQQIRDFGATVDEIDVQKITRKERISQLAKQYPDAYISSPFDDNLVIEGNATMAIEISLLDEKEFGKFDFVIAPISGGGGTSGLIKGFKDMNYETKVVAAEPTMANDASLSLKAGKIISNKTEPTTLADGARAICVGNLNFEILKNGLDSVVEIKEELIGEALKLFFTYSNLKCEPTAALPLAAILAQPQKFKDKNVCVVVTGANCDVSAYVSLLQ